MAKLIRIEGTRGAQLNRRRTLEVDLPEWLIRVLEYRLAEANQDSGDGLVDMNDVIEWHLVSPITLKDVPIYEAAIPGISAALSRWIEESAYEPPE
jgi:hypothetical protein